MLATLVEEIYSEKPANSLFHYTSLRGLLGIVEAKALWASEIHYLNDAEELRHLGRWLDTEIGQRLSKEPNDILSNLRRWIAQRLDSGPKVFIGSFTENGNLLSQWRGYCPHGKGVSLGFSPEKLIKSARDGGYAAGRCIYDRERKYAIAKQVVEGFLAIGRERGPDPKKHPLNAYDSAFGELEADFLRIAALVKDSSFREECEWRFVSEVFNNYVEPPILYREGAYMLVPYMVLPLPVGMADRRGVDIENVVIGPTPNVNLSIDSVLTFLAKAGTPRPSISNSQIPYRG